MTTPDDTQQLGPPIPGGPPFDGDRGPGHHRRWIWLLVAGVAALVLLVPLVTYALLGTGGSGSDDQPGAAPGAPTEPATSQPPTTTPEPTEPGSPSAGPKAPDGRIPLSVLRNATLDISAWPAGELQGPSGPVTFTDGQSEEQPSTGFRTYLADRLAYGDVDRDGAQETVIRVGFGGEGQSFQVLALDRNAKRKIITLGRVVATTGQIQVIDENVVVTAAGQVRIRVGDFQACCGVDPIAQWQTRVYAWRSGRFVQVGGPTVFPPNPRMTELTVAAKDVVLGVPVKGVRHGVLSMTVRVVKPVRPDHLRIIMTLPEDVIREGGAWAGASVEPAGNGVVRVELDAVAPAVGQSRTYTFRLGRAADASAGDTISVSAYGRTAQDQEMFEYESDNHQLMKISVV